MEQRWAQAISDVINDRNTPRFHFLVRGESMLPTLQPGDKVVVERVTLEGLHRGDVVLVQNGEHTRLHRFLGIRQQRGRRFLITAGDHMRRADAPWPEEALIGRAVVAYRGGEVLDPPTGRWQSWRHRARTTFWAAAYRIRQALPLLVLLLLLGVPADRSQASVTLISFKAKWVGDGVEVTWETASEIDNMGFYVHRSEQEAGVYEQRTDLILSQGDIIGAFYQWEDKDVEPGKTYYYKLEDLSASGPSKFWGPVAAAGGEPTATFTPTLTETPTPSATPSFTPTPVPTATPTSTATPSPAPSSTPTASPTPMPTLTRTPAPSPSPTPTSRATWTATPTRWPSVTAGSTSALAQPSAISLTGEPPAATIGPGTVVPAGTAAPPVPAELALQTSATPAPAPLDTGQPEPTVAAATIGAQVPSDAEAAAGNPVSDEELAKAQRRLSWTLIGIGGMIINGLLLVLVGLTAYALYRWGLLRYG